MFSDIRAETVDVTGAQCIGSEIYQDITFTAALAGCQTAQTTSLVHLKVNLTTEGSLDPYGIDGGVASTVGDRKGEERGERNARDAEGEDDCWHTERMKRERTGE